MLKAQVTGSFALIDPTTSPASNKITFDLAKFFGVISDISTQIGNERDLVDTDNAVPLNLGGISTVKAFLLRVVGPGTVVVKHDTNTNGLEVSSGIILFGKIGTITIETVATTPVHVEWLACG